MTALGPDAPNAVGLVYIAAFGLDKGESLGALLSQGPVTPSLAHLFTDSRGFGWLSEDDFVNHFAAYVYLMRARVMYAVQQALASSAFTDVMAAPAWRSPPSWYLVAQNDEAIPPDAERMFASRMVTTVEIPSSHVAMVSHPDQVVELIGEARPPVPERPPPADARTSGSVSMAATETPPCTEPLRPYASRPTTRLSTPTESSATVTCRSGCCSTSAATSTTGTPRSSTRSPRNGAWSPSTTLGSQTMSGTTPNTVEAMAQDAIAFLAAMKSFKRPDPLASPSAASSRRRSRSSAPTSCGASCSPPPHRRVRPACMAGLRRRSARSVSRRRARRDTSPSSPLRRRRVSRQASRPQCPSSGEGQAAEISQLQTRQAQYDEPPYGTEPRHNKAIETEA